MLWRYMSQIDDSFSQEDPSRWAIGEIGGSSWNLSGKTERVRRLCASNL